MSQTYNDWIDGRYTTVYTKNSTGVVFFIGPDEAPNWVALRPAVALQGVRLALLDGNKEVLWSCEIATLKACSTTFSHITLKGATLGRLRLVITNVGDLPDFTLSATLGIIHV